MSLFVDTSAWYAAVDQGDIDHERSKAILARESGLITSNHVLIETWTLLRVRHHKAVADKFWRGIRDGIAHVEMVTAQDFERAWVTNEDFPDQDFSIVDLTSFTVMQRLKLLRVASFDNHFAVFRFGQSRRHAFELVR